MSMGYETTKLRILANFCIRSTPYGVNAPTDLCDSVIDEDAILATEKYYLDSQSSLTSRTVGLTDCNKIRILSIVLCKLLLPAADPRVSEANHRTCLHPRQRSDC